MIRKTRTRCLSVWIPAIFLFVCFLGYSNVFAGQAPPAPEMPAHWKVVSDYPVPEGQLSAMAHKLGANLDSLRNTVYDVNGKRVQINVIVTSDAANAEKLLTKLRSVKSDEALLRKGLVVYEFVGPNDVLPVIAEGRNYLTAKKK
jgi:hypothetical protein